MRYIYLKPMEKCDLLYCLSRPAEHCRHERGASSGPQCTTVVHCSLPGHRKLASCSQVGTAV